MRRIKLIKQSIRLGPKRRLVIYLICTGLWLSGVLWLLFHYFVRTPTDFGPSPHPLESWWLALHGAFGFAAMWMLGLLSGSHVVNGWVSRRRRWSGSILLGASATMALTGYLLYYSGDEALRAISSYAHWGLGLIAPILFLSHRLWAHIRGWSKSSSAATDESSVDQVA